MKSFLQNLNHPAENTTVFESSKELIQRKEAGSTSLLSTNDAHRTLQSNGQFCITFTY